MGSEYHTCPECAMECDCGVTPPSCESCSLCQSSKEVKGMIDAAVRAEREACALLAENEPEPSPHDAPETILISSPVDAAIGGIRATKRCIARAIRARNEGTTDAK